MKKKENQRITLTKRLLKESLLTLMKTKNIQKISVSELCESAGINRSTFYNHYGCPTDVLIDIENSVIADLEEICEEESAKQNWTMDKRTEALCRYLQKNLELSKLLFRDSDTDSEFATLLANASHIRAAFEQAFSYMEDPDSKKLLITFLTNGAYHLIRQWLLEDIPKTPEEIGKLIYSMAIHGWEK